MLTKMKSVRVVWPLLLAALVLTTGTPSTYAWSSAQATVSVFGGAGTDWGFSIAVDSSGNVYTTGYFQGTVDFDPGAGTSNLTSAGGADVFVSKLDSSGALVWAKSFGGASADRGQSIAVDSSGNVYTIGYFAGTVDFDPGTGTSNLTSAGSGDVFVLKLTSSGEALTVAAPAFTLSASSESRTVNTTATGFTINSTGGAIASFSINATPPGMSFNTSTGALTGTPNTVASATNYTITATNASGSATQTFSLTVTAALAAPVAVAPTPVPYLKTLTTPKLNLKDGKLICTPGTYNAGYTLNGVTQGSTTTLFTPSSFTFNFLVNGITQTSLTVTTALSNASWNLPTTPSGAIISCSVTVSANGVTNTDKSTDNTSAVSSALSTQALAISEAKTDYSISQTAISKAYQKALVDNRAKWRSDTEKIRTDYYAERDRIKSLPSTKSTRAQASAALKTYTAAQKKSAVDYRASKPAAAATRDAANKAALDSKNTAIAKANATYGTFIESIGYGVLIP
jgi:hypothetical protein